MFVSHYGIAHIYMYVPGVGKRLLNEDHNNS